MVVPNQGCTSESSGAWGQIFILFIFFFFVALGLELKAFTLSHSTSPFF
jgi:hypothetical protein